MTARSNPPTWFSRATKRWAIGVMVGGTCLIAGLFVYVEVLVRTGWYVSVELVLSLFVPYFLCGLMVLLANGARLARFFVGFLLVTGISLDAFIAWEFTGSVVRTGGPPSMPASIFVGILVLVGQYVAVGIALFTAWIHWMATPDQPAQRPTQEERDYAD